MTGGKKVLEGELILLLEDEAFIAMAIRESLMSAGALDVVHAFTVEDAFELIEGSTFGGAILDVRLPGGTTCFDVALELSKRDVAIVFHSGHVQVDFAESFPMAVFCGKPASPGTLLDALDKARSNLRSVAGG